MSAEEEPMSEEEREWMAYEEGWDEGYQDGILDFTASDRERQKIGAKLIAESTLEDLRRKQ